MDLNKAFTVLTALYTNAKCKLPEAIKTLQALTNDCVNLDNLDTLSRDWYTTVERPLKTLDNSGKFNKVIIISEEQISALKVFSEHRISLGLNDASHEESTDAFDDYAFELICQKFETSLQNHQLDRQLLLAFLSTCDRDSFDYLVSLCENYLLTFDEDDDEESDEDTQENGEGEDDDEEDDFFDSDEEELHPVLAWCGELRDIRNGSVFDETILTQRRTLWKKLSEEIDVQEINEEAKVLIKAVIKKQMTKLERLNVFASILSE